MKLCWGNTLKMCAEESDRLTVYWPSTACRESGAQKLLSVDETISREICVITFLPPQPTSEDEEVLRRARRMYQFEIASESEEDNLNIMELFLQFRLIRILSKYNRRNKAPTRECFVDYVIKNHRHECLYNSDSDLEYKNRINNTLGDCIAPTADRKERGKYYIAYDEDRMSLLVTSEGRKFTTWLGFVEIFLKHHARTKELLFWFLGTLALINWRSILEFIKEIIVNINRAI